MDHWPPLFGAGPEGARQMLATLAGSMMSVMGITFSMTLVALTLASSIIASIAKETISSIERLFPKQLEDALEEDQKHAKKRLHLDEKIWQEVPADRYGYIQIVDMALRALSPGVNDTYTAVICVDYLTAIFSTTCVSGISVPRLLRR